METHSQDKWKLYLKWHYMKDVEAVYHNRQLNTEWFNNMWVALNTVGSVILLSCVTSLNRRGIAIPFQYWKTTFRRPLMVSWQPASLKSSGCSLEKKLFWYKCYSRLLVFTETSSQLLKLWLKQEKNEDEIIFGSCSLLFLYFPLLGLPSSRWDLRDLPELLLITRL